MELVISKHFLCKELVHHPIDSQPLFSLDGHEVPGKSQAAKVRAFEGFPGLT